jgi:hypothetical protein
MSRGLKAVGLFIAFAVIFTLSRHVIGTNSTQVTVPSSTPTTSIATTSTTNAGSVSTTTTTKVTQTSSTCVAGDFKAAYNVGPAATGTAYGTIVFTMTSGTSCTIVGYPSFTLQDKYGSVLHSVIVEIPRSSTLVNFPDAAANKPATELTIQNGQSFSEDVAYSDIPVGKTTCENVAALSLQLQINSASIALPLEYPLTACNGGKLWVSPFYN